MKVYRDLAYVKKRKRAAILTSLGGVFLLGSSYYLVFTGGQSELRAVFAYIPLLAGIIVFHLGMQQVGKWNRAQRNDVILDNLFKDFGDRFTVIHYSTIGSRPLDAILKSLRDRFTVNINPRIGSRNLDAILKDLSNRFTENHNPRFGGRTVEHVMVYPGGVLTITARELPGGVSHRDGRWRKVKQGFSRFFGMGGAFLGNPTSDAANDVKAVSAKLAENHTDADVDAVVAFINPRVTIDVEEPDFPVTNGEGLAPYIAALPAQPALQPAERQRLVEVLTAEGTFEAPQAAPTRRPVKRRAA